MNFTFFLLVFFLSVNKTKTKRKKIQKTKKIFLVFYADWLSPRVDYLDRLVKNTETLTHWHTVTLPHW